MKPAVIEKLLTEPKKHPECNGGQWNSNYSNKSVYPNLATVYVSLSMQIIHACN